jgi:DNA-binding NarL/FixJ family response regulator
MIGQTLLRISRGCHDAIAIRACRHFWMCARSSNRTAYQRRSIRLSQGHRCTIARNGPIAQAGASVYQRIGAGAPWTRRVARAVQPMVVREPAPPHGLTPRQAEVLRRLADGKTNSEIAQELAFSTRTVERHIEAIYAKIGASGPTARAQAAAYAYRHRLVVGPTAEG